MSKRANRGDTVREVQQGKLWEFSDDKIGFKAELGIHATDRKQ